MMTSISLCVALGALLATPATAKAKSSKPMLDMQKVATPQHRVRPPKAQIPMAPQLSAQDFFWAKQDNLRRLGDRQIVYLQRMLQLTSPDDPQLPDFFFRLAELYAEKYRYFDRQARRLDEAIFRAEHPPAQAEPQ
jgi:hypothetical protein